MCSIKLFDYLHCSVSIVSFAVLQSCLISLSSKLKSYIPFSKSPLLHLLQYRCSHPSLSGCSLYFWQYLLGRLRQCLPEMLVSCFYIIYCVDTCHAFRDLLIILSAVSKSSCNLTSAFFLLRVLNFTFIVATIGTWSLPQSAPGYPFNLCDSIAKPFIHSDVINLISNTVTWTLPSV